MAFTLLKNIAQQAVNTVGADVNSAVNYLRQHAPEVFPEAPAAPAPETTVEAPTAQPPAAPQPGSAGDIANKVDQFIQAITAEKQHAPTDQGLATKIGGVLEKTPDTTIDPNAILSKNPVSKLFSLSPVQNEEAKMLSGAVGSTAQQTGKAITNVSTPQGRQDILKGLTEYPAQGKEVVTPGQTKKGVADLFNNPATVTALGLTNVIPNPKTLVEAGVEDVAKNAGKTAVEDAAKTDVKNNIVKNVTRATEAPASTTQKLFSGGQKTIGAVQEATQSPDLTAYEKAINSGDAKAADALSQAHPDDARFQVHKEIPGFSGPIEPPAGAPPAGGNPPLPKDALEVQAALKPGNQYSPKGNFQKVIDAVFRPSKNVIGSQGAAGAQIVKLLNASDLHGDLTSGAQIQQLKDAFKPLNKDELNSFSDVVEGKQLPLSDTQANAVKTWQGIAQDILKRRGEAGLQGGTIENYYPHQPLPLSNSDKALMAQDMVTNGKAGSVEEALGQIEQQGGSLGRTSPRRFGNLELPRESTLPYDKNPNSLIGYIEGANKRISDAMHFGANDENLYKLASTAGTQGGDSNQIMQYVDQILGKNQGKSWSRPITSLQTITKLNPLTSVTNLTQNLSTWLRTDTGSMAKTMGTIVANPDVAFARAVKTGEIDTNLAKQLEDYTGGGGAASKWIRLIGMQGTEKFNRVMAVNSGYEYAAKLAKQAVGGSEAAVRELDRFGITPKDIGPDGTLQEQALLKVGRQVSRETQFSTAPGELPYGWRTNVGKVATQFKSFSYKQTGFLGQTVKRIGSEAAQGNLKPFANFLIVGGIAAPLAGEVVNDLRSLLTNKKRTDTGSLAQRYVGNILGATSFGLFDSTAGLLGQYGESGIVSTLGGPTAGDAVKLATAGADASKGVQNYDPTKSVTANLDPNNTTQRLFLKEIPGAGQAISNTVVPNSYVDNVFGGVNNGLTKADNQTYNTMKQVDPQAAEQFKQNHQAQNNQQTGASTKPTEFSALFSPKQANAWALPKDKTQSTAFNKQVDVALQNNATVPDQALNQRYFGGATYDKSSRSGQQTILTAALKVQDDKYLTDTQKAAILKTAKINPADLSYYKAASGNQDDRLAQLLDYANNNTDDRQTFLENLIMGKKQVAGKSLFSTAMYNQLYNEGYTTKEENALISAVKYDPIFNKFYVDQSYLAAQAKAAGKGSLTASQVRSYTNRINTLFKDPIQNTSSGNGGTGGAKSPLTKPVAPPKQIKFPTPRVGFKRKNQWFKTY